jgi:hypothetical protein
VSAAQLSAVSAFAKACEHVDRVMRGDRVDLPALRNGAVLALASALYTGREATAELVLEEVAASLLPARPNPGTEPA